MLREPLVALLPAAWQGRVHAFVRGRGRPAGGLPAALALRFYVSAVLGASTHVVWDAFTHHDRWGTKVLPVLGRGGRRASRCISYAQYGSFGAGPGGAGAGSRRPRCGGSRRGRRRPRPCRCSTGGGGGWRGAAGGVRAARRRTAVRALVRVLRAGRHAPRHHPDRLLRRGRGPRGGAAAVRGGGCGCGSRVRAADRARHRSAAGRGRPARRPAARARAPPPGARAAPRSVRRGLPVRADAHRDVQRRAQLDRARPSRGGPVPPPAPARPARSPARFRRGPGAASGTSSFASVSARSTFSIATLTMSAAVPWIGALSAIRSAASRRWRLSLLRSGR